MNVGITDLPQKSYSKKTIFFLKKLQNSKSG